SRWPWRPSWCGCEIPWAPPRRRLIWTLAACLTARRASTPTRPHNRAGAPRAAGLECHPQECRMSLANPSRRSFLKTVAIGGTTLYIAPLGSKAYAALFEQQLLTPVQWNAADGRARFRIDGIA